MRARFLRACSLLLVPLLLCATSVGSAYNARPKLIVIIVIDQFRGDMLERYRGQFGDSGFRLFLDRGAVFTDCNYDYANTRTAPGHATLLTGAYTSGHGILSNEWWDTTTKRIVTSVFDEATKIVGSGEAAGASPHNLLADTLGDELKLATYGKARVFGTALKDRAAILPAGYSGDAAYWIDQDSGAFISSTYYMRELPPWVKDFNAGRRAEKYWNLDWKDRSGKVLRTTVPQKKKAGTLGGFYEIVGATPFANDYQLEFARELIVNEKLGSGPATDLLVISLSANDILGHKVGPDSAEMQAMALALDRQLSDFFASLGRQFGLANVWLVLSADHGVAPLPAFASRLHIPSTTLDRAAMRAQINAAIASKLSGRSAEYVSALDWPQLYLSEQAFASANVKEADAERLAGEALKQTGMRAYFTRSQLAAGEVPADELGRKYLHSYSPYGGWYVLGVPQPFAVSIRNQTDHATPYTYDTHVPMAFYGLAFQPGAYRSHCETVDMAATLASLLGINAPTHAVGRVLREALTPASFNRIEPPR